MKIALVTGASSGLGREFALMIPKLYEDLDEIWVIARRLDRLRELKDQMDLPVRIFDGDLTRTAVYNHLEKAMNQLHPDIRLLVNAAGYGKYGHYEDIDPDEQLGMIDLNCRALTKMTLLCLPYMGKGARIIELASAAAFAPEPTFGTYAATKSYVYSFSRSLGYDLKDRKISVTAVCPGPVKTEFFTHAGPADNKEPENDSAAKGMADPKKVVRQALIDAARRRPVSVYGTTMKLARAAAKILPDGLSVGFMGIYGAKIREDGENK